MWDCVEKGIVELALIVDKYGPIMESNRGNMGGGIQDDLELVQISVLPFIPDLRRVDVLMQNISRANLIASYLSGVR